MSTRKGAEDGGRSSSGSKAERAGRVVEETSDVPFLLSDILRRWGMWELLKEAYGQDQGGDDTEGVPAGLPDEPPEMPWECTMCPTASTEEELLHWLHEGVPCFVSEEYARDTYARSGKDALEFVTRPQWNKFPKPRIAFKSGWGRPGTPISDYDKLALVSSFQEVLESNDVLNLQMFHREGEDEPKLPCLPLDLQWPLPEVFGHRSECVLEGKQFTDEQQQEALVGGRQSQDVGAGVVVDNATRVSKQAALTWWHLDDGGEFVYQVALPLKAPAYLRGPTGKPVTKVFVFAPLDAYDLMYQDDRTNDDYTISALDLFRTPSHHLPYDPASGKPRVPRLWVAALEAGGRPLLSTPNVPHLVLTMQDCVMVEQRRIGKLFVDEVAYFVQRARRWAEPPVMYSFITKQLQDAAYLRHTFVPMLIQAATGALTGSALAEANQAGNKEQRQQQQQQQQKHMPREAQTCKPAQQCLDCSTFVAQRAMASLRSLHKHHKLFNVDADTRERIAAFLRAVRRRAEEGAGDGSPGSQSHTQEEQRVLTKGQDTGEEESKVQPVEVAGEREAQELQALAAVAPSRAAEVVAHDPRERRIEAVIDRMRTTITGVTPIGDEQFAARVHVDGCPRFGAVRDTTQAVSRDLAQLKRRVEESPQALEEALLSLHKQHDMTVFDVPASDATAAKEPTFDDLFD